MTDNTRIVFISGAFNTVHAGHIRLFMFAKKIAARLVVAVYDDEMIGFRISQGVADRKMSLEAVKLIDEVIVIRDGVINCIRDVRPDFIVKGAEHQKLVNIEEEYCSENSHCKIVFSSGATEDPLLIKKQKASIDKPINFLEKHGIQTIELFNIIDKFKEKRVVVLGDAIVDEYLECLPLGMSQEDPTIVVKPLSSKKYIGGAAIVAAHAKSLGSSVHFITSLGNDEEASFIKKELDHLGISFDYTKDEFRPTTLKTRVRANGKTLLRISRLEENLLDEVHQNEIYSFLIDVIQNTDLVIISDFNYGIMSDTLLEKVTKICEKNNVPISADSQSSSQLGDISRYKKVLLVTPTEREARLSLRNKEDNLTVISDLLRSQCEAQYVIITLGENGILINQDYDKTNWKTDQIRALNHSPIDVAGAGDSLLTVSSLALISGASIWQASYIGSVAAAIQVSRIGNLPIDIEQLRNTLDVDY